MSRSIYRVCDICENICENGNLILLPQILYEHVLLLGGDDGDGRAVLSEPSCST